MDFYCEAFSPFLLHATHFVCVGVKARNKSIFHTFGRLVIEAVFGFESINEY